jgi:hypothetical protein
VEFFRKVAKKRKIDIQDIPIPSGVDEFRCFATEVGTRIKWLGDLS